MPGFRQHPQGRKHPRKKTEVLDLDAVAAAHLADHLGIPLAKWHKLAGIWYTQAKNPKSPHHNAASDRLVLMLQTEHAARRDLIRGGALVRAAQEIGQVVHDDTELEAAVINLLSYKQQNNDHSDPAATVPLERPTEAPVQQGAPRRFRRATMAGPGGERVDGEPRPLAEGTAS